MNQKSKSGDKNVHTNCVEGPSAIVRATLTAAGNNTVIEVRTRSCSAHGTYAGEERATRKGGKWGGERRAEQEARKSRWTEEMEGTGEDAGGTGAICLLTFILFSLLSAATFSLLVSPAASYPV